MLKLKGYLLDVKENWQIFKICKNIPDYKLEGKKRKIIGRKIDFVGNCFGIGFTTIRKRVSLAFIRTCRSVIRLYKRSRNIPLKLAQSLISRATCLMYTNSERLKKKYLDKIDILYIKDIISKHSKGILKSKKYKKFLTIYERVCRDRDNKINNKYRSKIKIKSKLPIHFSYA